MPTIATNTATSLLEDYFNRCSVAGGEIASSVAIPIYDSRNLLSRSQELGDAVWNSVGLTVSADVAVAPDGTTTADKLVETATTGSHYFSRNAQLTITSGTTYTSSVYAKAGERTILYLNPDSSSTSGLKAATFDLSSGTVTNTETGGTAAITSAGNGWYRCSVSSVATGTLVRGLSPSLRTTSGLGYQSYTGDGTSGLFLWGAQFEVGASPTTYFATTAIPSFGTPTFGAATTRTVNPRQQLIDFCLGVNALGLWDTSVFWPLRTIHNIGTGSTALSLGGLGIYSGTLTSGPSWGNTGLTCTFGSGQYLLTTLGMSALKTSFAAWAPTATHAMGRVLSRVGGGAYFGASSASNSGEFSPTAGTYTTITFPSSNAVGYYGCDAVVADTSIIPYRNGVAGTSVAATITWPTTGAATVFNAGTTSNVAASVAVAGFSTSVLTASQVAGLNTLFRNTLGSGLPLQ